MITTWSAGTPEANMDEQILIDLSRVVARHPWWLARADLVLALLETLDIRPPGSSRRAAAGEPISRRSKRQGIKLPDWTYHEKCLTASTATIAALSKRI